MARRSDHTRDELKRLMILSAKQIIAEQGLSGLSARELADRVGYSAGTIYNIFDNLNEIILSVEAEVLEALEQQLSAIPNDIPPRQQLHAFADQYIKFISEHYNLWYLLCEQNTTSGKSLPDWYTEKLNSLVTILENMLESFFNETDADNCQKAARVFWATLHGIILLSGHGKLSVISPDETNDSIELLVTTYVAGLTQINSA